MTETSRSYVWLRELLEDPDLLEPPRAIVPRLVWKERTTLLAAREKCGKSTLAGACAAAVSSGRDFFGFRCVPANVLIISLEEHSSDFVRRLVRFGADPDRIAVVSRTDTDLIRAIWRAAEEIKPALIVWDTLGAFANHISGGKDLDPGDSQGWTRVMNEITEIARTFGATLILHHARKSDGKYRDSTAIGANVDMILTMHGEGAEPRIIKGIGRFDIEETRFTIEGDEFRLLETTEQVQRRVHQFIAKNPNCSWRDLTEGVGGRKEEIQKARDALVKKGAIANSGGTRGGPDGGGHRYIATVVPT